MLRNCAARLLEVGSNAANTSTEIPNVRDVRVILGAISSLPGIVQVRVNAAADTAYKLEDRAPQSHGYNTKTHFLGVMPRAFSMAAGS